MNLRYIFNTMIYFFLTITLSNCEKDCNGTYTIEGTITNGTKGKPRTGILVKAVAGKGNSLFSGGSNVQDVGNARTDENGYFKITYNCIGDDMTGISLSSPDLPYSGISNNDRLPINQDYKQTYNIPDSSTIKVTLTTNLNLNDNDTVYLCAPNATNSNYGDETYYNRYYIYSKKDINTTKIYRIKYEYRSNGGYSVVFLAAVGYQNLLAKIANKKPITFVLSKLEPETNDITINIE